MAAERIMAGFADCIVAGGTESMTMVPMVGNKFCANPDLIADWPEAYASMGITAEKVAEQFNISREDQDAFGLQSNERALQAIENGKFAEEIVPVEVERTKIVNNELF
jgi:acetyl-CoA acyltransferase